MFSAEINFVSENATPLLVATFWHRSNACTSSPNHRDRARSAEQPCATLVRRPPPGAGAGWGWWHWLGLLLLRDSSPSTLRTRGCSARSTLPPFACCTENPLGHRPRPLGGMLGFRHFHNRFAAAFNSSASRHAAWVTSSNSSIWSAYPIPLNDVSQEPSSSSVMPLSVSYQAARRCESDQPP